MVGACPRRVAEKRCSSGCRVTWGRGGYKRAGEHTYRALTFWLKREPRRAYGPQAKGETTALVCGGGEALAAAPAAVAATAQVSTYTVQSTSAFGHFSLRAISTCHEVFMNTHLEMHQLHSLWRGVPPQECCWALPSASKHSANSPGHHQPYECLSAPCCRCCLTQLSCVSEHKLRCINSTAMSSTNGCTTMLYW